MWIEFPFLAVPGTRPWNLPGRTHQLHVVDGDVRVAVRDRNGQASAGRISLGKRKGRRYAATETHEHAQC